MGEYKRTATNRKGLVAACFIPVHGLSEFRGKEDIVHFQRKIKMDKNEIRVGIVMGSTSDWPVMEAAAKVLDDFEIGYEKKVLSAHRTPAQLEQWASTARQRGISVLIAGAGGAAHLAGVVAAFTTLPVIGVPVKSRSLEGLDSLLSMVQMPPGIPVATVGIDGAKNAALLAVEIMAVADDSLKEALDAFRIEQARKVLESEI